jgi:hypothetical protein
MIFPSDQRNDYDISAVNVVRLHCQKPQIFLLHILTFVSYYMPFYVVKSMYNTPKKKGRTSPLSSICPKNRYLLRNNATLGYQNQGFSFSILL